MATKPTLSDSIYALNISLGKQPFDAKYDVNGDGSINTTDVVGLQKAYLGKDPGFAFVADSFLSPSTKTAEEYAAENKANQERIAAEQKETDRRKTLLSDAQKIFGGVTSDLVDKNPNFSAKQLANLATRNYWSGESEAFSRVMTAMENGTAKLVKTGGYDMDGNPYEGLSITSGDSPGYDTLNLTPTGTPNVYQFSTGNQVAGGTISGVIVANPETGKYLPVQDYTTQIKYAPGQSGSFFGNLIGTIGDTVKELGPIATIVGNAIVPGLGTALSVAAAIDEGADPVDIAKNVAIGEIVNQVGVGSGLTDSAVAADMVDNTVKGLLSGQDFETAITNAAVNTGVSNVAASATNQTPEDFQADVDTVLDSPASTPVSDYYLDFENILDLPTTEPVSGQDLAADAIPGNTIDDIINVLPPLTEPQLPPAPPAPTEPGLTKAQVETLIKTALAATAATTAADQLTSQSDTKPPGFDIVPVPTDWKSPVYDQSFTPIDLDSIFQNLQGAQTQWQPRPSITGGAFMGSPVNISDIVNQIMGSELTPQAMPTNITNAVGGVLGSTTTR